MSWSYGISFGVGSSTTPDLASACASWLPRSGADLPCRYESGRPLRSFNAMVMVLDFLRGLLVDGAPALVAEPGPCLTVAAQDLLGGSELMPLDHCRANLSRLGLLPRTSSRSRLRVRTTQALRRVLSSVVGDAVLAVAIALCISDTHPVPVRMPSGRRQAAVVPTVVTLQLSQSCQLAGC